MDTPSRARWEQLGRALQATAAWGFRYDELTARYETIGRSYHNLVHVAECLREWDDLRPDEVDGRGIEAAIWFHDIVYDPRAHDNEEQSARLMRTWLVVCGISETFIGAVDRLIMVTRTHQPRRGASDEAIVSDVDLAILGQPAARFDAYETQVRQEYSWVPEDSYRTGRAAVLERFLARERIYCTDMMFRRYERTARANLQRSVERLRQSS